MEVGLQPAKITLAKRGKRACLNVKFSGRRGTGHYNVRISGEVNRWHVE